MCELVGRLEPPEPKCDGAFTCDCCKEIIPGDSGMYVLNGMYFCENCVENARVTAPYREEVYDE